MGPEKKRRCSRTTINDLRNGFLVQWQSLARLKSVLWLGLPLIVLCQRVYSHKENVKLFCLCFAKQGFHCWNMNIFCTFCHFRTILTIERHNDIILFL